MSGDLTPTELRAADQIANRSAAAAMNCDEIRVINGSAFDSWVAGLGYREGIRVLTDRAINTGTVTLKQEMTKAEFKRRWPNA